MRKDKRRSAQTRAVKIARGYLKYADGSALVEFGDTKVVCSASIEEGVPRFLKGSGQGWITAEYAMLPASCKERIQRDSSKGRPSGRAHEIQRLIGRSLRMAVDLSQIGERTIWIDCDVLQGDGGTRTASITGGFVALVEALAKLKKARLIDRIPLKYFVAAVSVGIVNGEPMLDLDYQEDSGADADMNFVMTDSGDLIEVQGTAERAPFSLLQMERLTGLARRGIRDIVRIQRKALKMP